MKKLFVLAILILFATPCFAERVSGYFRKDGTCVGSYERSSPDGYKWNNYGPKDSGDSFGGVRQRDNDRDGVPNYKDKDDDNDGVSDDKDKSQYGRSSF